MFFLIRTAFWLTLVLVLIPLGSGKETSPTENVNPVSAYLAAQATVSDIGSFCQRNPLACETGGNALTAIGSRARDGARIVYEFLDTKIAESDEDQPLVTGSTSVQLTSDVVQTVASADEGQTAQDALSSETTNFGPIPKPKPSSRTSS